MKPERPISELRKKNVRMIGHQCPGIDCGFGTGSKSSQTLDKIFTVGNLTGVAVFSCISRKFVTIDF
jgi:hypothetical protein